MVDEFAGLHLLASLALVQRQRWTVLGLTPDERLARRQRRHRRRGGSGGARPATPKAVIGAAIGTWACGGANAKVRSSSKTRKSQRPGTAGGTSCLQRMATYPVAPIAPIDNCQQHASSTATEAEHPSRRILTSACSVKAQSGSDWRCM